MGTSGDPRAPGLPSGLLDLTTPEHLIGRSFGGLSDWFDPFLPGFARETLRCGGEVLVAPDATGRPVGLLVYSPPEALGSIFTRSRAIAAAMREVRPAGSFYCELEDLPGPAERFSIYALDLSDRPAPHEFLFPVRVATPRDLPELLRTMTEIHGGFDARGWAGADPADERCFVVGLEGRIAAAAWVTRAGRQGRLHSVSVLPRYRRLGIGSELVVGRLAWLRAAGAERALSEISERNRASRAIAEAAGMRPVATIRRYDPTPDAERRSSPP